MSITTPVRVLLLLEAFATGGAERSFHHLAAHLPPERFDVRIGTLKPGGGLAADFAALGRPIVPFHRRWRWDLSPVARLADYCRREEIAIVHGMHWLSGTFAALAARRVPGLRAIGSTVSLYYDEARLGRLRAWSDRRLAPHLAAMMVNTMMLRGYLIAHHFPADRICIVPNGVVAPDLSQKAVLRAAIRARYGIPLDAPCIGILARLHPVKDHATFLQAAHLVMQTRPDARFMVAGDGEERTRLVALAAHLGISDRVVFTGAVAGAAAVVPAWDIAALTSLREGLPNAVMEALAWGVPVVATNVGGVPDVVVPHVTGALVRRNDPASLAAALLDLINDPARATHLGATGRQQIMARWSLAQMVDACATMYAFALDDATHRPAVAAQTRDREVVHAHPHL